MWLFYFHFLLPWLFICQSICNVNFIALKGLLDVLNFFFIIFDQINASGIIFQIFLPNLLPFQQLSPKFLSSLLFTLQLYLIGILLAYCFPLRLHVLSVNEVLNTSVVNIVLLLFCFIQLFLPFLKPKLQIIGDICQARDRLPSVILVPQFFPFDQVVWLIINDCFIKYFLNLIYFALIETIHFTFYNLTMVFALLTKTIHRSGSKIQLFCLLLEKLKSHSSNGCFLHLELKASSGGLQICLYALWLPNIFIMQEKLIVTLWKAQLKELSKEDSIYCRLTYNNTERNSKPTTHQKNLAWKQTFIFPLAKRESPLKLEFIGLKQGQAIHFAKDQVAESMSFGKSIISIQLDNPHQGSLPCKVDIMDKQDESVGKIFIEYEVIKTEVAYTVQKQLDYFYLLKLTNFRANFVRKLKSTPKFFLHFNIQGRQQKEDLPFEEQQGGVFVYNYPVKIYLKKELEMEVQLFMNDTGTLDEGNSRRPDYPTESSFSQSIFTEKKTFKSSVGKKQKQLLELGKDKISAIMDLNFKKDTRLNKKLSLATLIKFQKREIGTIQFQAEVFFRTKEELQELEEQKKGLNPQKEFKPLQRKKSLVKQTNGIITVNSILGKLELFNDSIIQNKNISVEVKLGNQVKQSIVLQKPGKQLIFIDTFVFKRTWQETVKFIINIHQNEQQKSAAFFADLNLRELFELGRYISKKVKLKDENKNYSGQLILDLVYKEVQQKKSPIKEEMATISEVPQEEMEEMKVKMKREQIEQRMRRRQEMKEKARQLNSMSTLAVLQNNDIILPPLKSISRMTTLSPKNERTRGANVFNVNGGIKIPRSPRFQSYQRPGYESYIYVRQSDFDSKKKKGTYIGYGNKYDFTKVLALNPGVGRYEIPSVWDKYK